MSVDVTALAIRVESTGIREASQALGGLSTSAANSTKRVAAFEAAMARLNAATKMSTTAMGDYSTKLQKHLNVMAALNTHTSQMAASTTSLTIAMTTLASAIALLDVQSNRATRTQNTHNLSMKEGHALARGLSGSLGALWVTYGNLAGMAVGVAIGASLKSIIVIGKDVEATLEGIRVKGMETTDSIAQMRTAVLSLGQGVYGPQEVAKAFEVLILAGLNAKQALVGIKDALNLATIGGTTVEKAAFTLVQVSTALGYTAEGYSRVGDVIAKTAAVSMSSVESLSEAFKSGSVIGKLYGVTLVDIGTSLAGLSNLGIQGSAAGTSLKNMYKELAADSDKLKKALKDIGLKPSDLKDTQGNFLGLIQMFAKLDEGLSKYTASEQKVLIARMANERGMKSLIENLSLYRAKLDETGGATGTFKTRMEAMNTAINESYGFMAQGAAAMALTVDAQFKSVKNTLETVLVKAFREIQPELSVVAVQMKAAFNSPEFISGVQTLAVAFGKLTVFVVENAAALFEIVRAILAFKAASFVIGLLVGMAEAFVVLKEAMAAARIASIAFQASLGLLGLALAAGAALMVMWATAKEKATTDTKSLAALTYMDDFTSKIKENNAELAKQIELMKSGATAAEALALSQQQLALQKVKEQGGVALGQANRRRGEVLSGMTDYQQTAVSDFFQKGVKPEKTDFAAIDAINKMIAANKNYSKVEAEVAQKQKDANDALNENIRLSKMKAEIADKQAKDKNTVVGGTGVLPEEVNKMRLNKEYAAAVLAQNNIIKASKKELERFEDNEYTKFRSGQIGKIELLRNVGIKTVQELEKQKTAIENIQSLAARKDDPAGIQQSKDMLEANEASLDAIKLKHKTDMNAHLEQLERQNTQNQVKELEAQGKFVEAATLKFSSEYSKAFAQAKADVEKFGNEFPEAVKAKEGFEALQNQMTNTAKVKEAAAAFELLNAQMVNTLKGVQTASEQGGLVAMFDAATMAAERYRSELPKLVEAQKALAAAAKLSQSPEDATKAEEAQTKITANAEKLKTMWSGIAEAISSSLEKAYGKAGKALGSLFKVTQDFAQKDKHTTSEKLKGYGDMADAAKGFFSEQSKGYKIMDAASKVFHAAETARLLYTTIKGVIAGAAQMFGQGGFAGFAGVAAMIAVMAALGYAASGGGGSGGGMSAAKMQETQGAGGVLGDSTAKSESIQKSLDLIEKNTYQGLTYSAGMLTALRAIQASMAGLANLVVRTEGITEGSNLGIKTGTLATGSAPGLNLASSLGKITLPGNLGGIFQSITDKLNSLWGKTTQKIIDSGLSFGGSLSNLKSGKGFNQYASVDTTKSSFFGLVKSTSNRVETQGLNEELSKQFGMIFDNLTDVLKLSAVNIGEDADAVAKALDAFVLPETKISLQGLKGEELTKAINNVISKAMDDISGAVFPSLKQFQKIGEGLAETVVRVATEYMAIDTVFSSFGKTFSQVGIASIAARERIIELSGGLENFSSQAEFFLNNFYTDEERAASLKKRIEPTLNKFGLSAEGADAKKMFRDFVVGLDTTTEEGAKTYATLMELAPAFKAVADAAEKAGSATEVMSRQRELEIQLQEALGNSEVALAMKRADVINALSKISPVLVGLQLQINSVLDKNALVAKAKGDLDQAYQRESTALQGVIDKFKAFSVALKAFKDDLLTGDLSPMSPEEKYLASKAKFQNVSALAASGDATALGQLQSVSQDFLENSRMYNASTERYANDFEMVQKGLDQGIAAADQQTSIAEMQLSIMKSQYTSLMGIDKNLMSFQAALMAYIEAKNIPAGGFGAGAGAGSDPTNTFRNGVPQMYGGDFASTRPDSGWIQAVLAKMDIAAAAQAAGVNIDGSHALGINSVPKDNYIAKLHMGERVQTAAAANASDKNSTELVTLTKQLIDAVERLEDHTAVSNAQRSSVHEMQTERDEVMISKLGEVKRAIASQKTK